MLITLETAASAAHYSIVSVRGGAPTGCSRPSTRGPAPNATWCWRPLRSNPTRVRAQAAPQSDKPVTGVIIVDHGSRRKESNQLVMELAAMFKGRTGYAIVEGAHMELAPPTIADAYDACVKQGAKRIVVTPYFLGPGRHWQEDIPALTAEAAAKHAGTEFLVAAPLGLHPLVVEALHSRMEHCVEQATAGSGATPETCDVCGGVAGKGPCTLTQAAAASPTAAAQ